MMRKAETLKACITRAFSGFSRRRELAAESPLTTGMTTDRENFQKEKIEYPGVAQLVARVVWDHQAAGSNPVTRTKNPLKSSISEDFSM
jgi:hypothetical protein